MTKNLPAILGGRAQFDRPLGIVRPCLPPLASIRDRLDGALRTGQLTNNGQYVREFERQLASWLGVRHAVAVCNATLALVLLLRALRDEWRDDTRRDVILPSFTFSATAHAIVWAGLRPVFADVLPDTYTLDSRSVLERVDDSTLAIMGVHVFGHPCEVEELEMIGRRRRVTVVYDAAHAIGSRYRGSRVGCFGAAEVFSFHATKVFPMGEGGAVATNDDGLADKLRLLREFGDPGTGNTSVPGLNARMQEFNALLGLENLTRINEHVERRRAVAGLMRERLASVPGLRFQTVRPLVETNYQNLAVCVDSTGFGLGRDDVDAALRAENIMCRKYFWPPLHLHDAYRGAPQPAGGDLKVTEEISAAILCLPIYSDMTDREASALCDAIERVHSHARGIQALLQSTPEEREPMEASIGRRTAS